MIDHRNGCAVVRTGRCTCAYLAQWDRTPGYTAPTWDVSIDEAREIAKDSDPMAPRVLNNPDHIWIPGDQLPLRETGR